MRDKIIGNPLITPNKVPDFNQNDPTKSDYIKNRPFYDNIIETEDETVVVMFDGEGHFTSISRGTALGLIPGNIYKLKFLGYKGDVLQDTYTPSPDGCKAAMGSFSSYVKLEFRDNDDWIITILDTTSSYVRDEDFAGELSNKLFPYLATWFESECDSYGVVIMGNFSRVETRYLDMRYIREASLPLPKFSEQTLRTLFNKIEKQAILAAPLLISPSGEKVFRLVVNEDGAVSTEDVTEEVS